MSLMVIGGSGFFGKSFLDAFRRGRLAPWDIGRIIVVARHARQLAYTHSDLTAAGVELIDADVGAVDRLPDADIIIHAASSTDAQRYVDAAAQERANIEASTENFCRIAALHHRSSRIVYTSSGAVYGQIDPLIERISEEDDGGAVSELVTYKQDYAIAKRAAEMRIAQLGSDGVAVAVARCFAFVGAYLPRDQHFAIGNFLADGLAGRRIEVKARHAVYRSYMHADDLVHWLMTIATVADSGCPIFNVGSDEAYTVGQVAQMVARRFDVDADVPSFTSDRVDRYIPSVARARETLGLRLAYDLPAAIDDIAGRLVQSACR
ncbi:NAD(P)-dependent oxidoreductase [Sphingobium sp. AN641]|uniref:NAD-dependent epimerase/dehydratase family protein n=1 Tax=Sphingobium sp. AN641 TaxID=3133443 RepID=UPI0030BC7DFB